MAGWHHQCNGHELGQTLGDGEGQGGLACCSPWGHKELDTTGQLNKSSVKSQYAFLDMNPNVETCMRTDPIHSSNPRRAITVKKNAGNSLLPGRA